tara:strand:+ start:6730 stop:7968 length:1239 start_codon:yes stop_codon:yes gene_type:complete
MNFRIFFVIGFFVLLDAYILWGSKAVFSKGSSLVFSIAYGLMALLFYMGLCLFFINFSERPLNATSKSNFLIGICFSFVIFKLLTSFFLVFEDLIRVFQYAFQSIARLFSVEKATVDFSSRRAFIFKLGLGLASIPFGSMLYGITKGKYNYKVKKLTLQFPNLPKAFDGFRMVQISDIHAGSFDDIEAVKRGVALVNDQKADVVFFTGDLVNNDALEVQPYVDVFKSMESKFGTYSILGNHDYGDYKKWPSRNAKKENFSLLEQFQKEMNFKLLKNEHVCLKRGIDELVVLGVENWGKPPFVAHGDLDNALKGVDENAFKILLSHDPSHWDAKVLPHATNVDLTLSGHTHGMQFGIDIPGFKWSPVKYKYPRWSGLYQKGMQHLYVNKGFGFLGFPGRVGMWPEITVIELTS